MLLAALTSSLLATGILAAPASDAVPPRPEVGRATADCDDLRNTTGITNRAVTISVASDIGGPAPGLHLSSQQAMGAFVAYFSASVPGGICGRALRLQKFNSRTEHRRRPAGRGRGLPAAASPRSGR